MYIQNIILQSAGDNPTGTRLQRGNACSVGRSRGLSLEMESLFESLEVGPRNRAKRVNSFRTFLRLETGGLE